MAYVIGVDVGGTFTDAVLDDDAGTVLAAKSPSTPPDYSRGVLDVLGVLAEQLVRPLPEMLADTHHVAHGTTSSLNALVTGNVPAVGAPVVFRQYCCPSCWTALYSAVVPADAVSPPAGAAVGPR